MTTKTQIGMFAILAFAVMSVGLVPIQDAFAWSSLKHAYTSETAGSNGTTETDSSVDYVCGQNITTTMHVKNANPTDKVELWYNISHCATWEKVYFNVNVNGGASEGTFTEYNNASGAQIFSTPLVSGNDVQGTVIYYW